MNKIINNHILKFVAGAAMFAMVASGPQAATFTANVDAQIFSNATISASSGMVFGDMTAGTLGGFVVLDPDGRRIASGSVSLNSASVSSPATLVLSGIPNGSFSIIMPSSVLLSDGRANFMTATNFRSSPATGGQLDGNGQETVRIGGTLNIGANQGFGIYSGSMTIVINYF